MKIKWYYPIVALVLSILIPLAAKYREEFLYGLFQFGCFLVGGTLFGGLMYYIYMWGRFEASQQIEEIENARRKEAEEIYRSILEQMKGREDE